MEPVLMFVSLFGKGVLVGPAWAEEAARSLTDAQLASHSVLMDVSRPYGGQALGEASLFFCDSMPPAPNPLQSVSFERSDAVTLEAACLPEDAAEVDLSSTERVWVLMDRGEGPARPVAGAGYDIWEDALAHRGVLTATDERRRGHALRASLVAARQHSVPALSLPAAKQPSSSRRQGPKPNPRLGCDARRIYLV